MSFDTVLIANRGAIACRIIRTLRTMGLRSVAVYSDADAGSLHVAEADLAIRIGAGPPGESYLNVDAILAAAREAGAGAIHPGYGFLAENAAFAEACAAAGIVFIGPTPDNIRAFGLKHSARALAIAHGVPLAPGSDLLVDVEDASAAAAAIGYPVMLKATAGGGGIGMRICRDEAEVREGFAGVVRQGAANFGDSGVFLERYVERARHIEVQIFGDGTGRVVPLGERDCSLQRRNQKVVEEAPAPNLPADARAGLIAAAVRLGEAARYRSAGTVEFLYDAARGDFFFLEVNTRLQVEHGVTEQVMGIDLVEWMIRAAAGDVSFLDAVPQVARGASIQVRLYAEDPALDYRPTSGKLTDVAFPADARVETWVASGVEVSSFYDPMLAKLIVTGPDRASAVLAMQAVLDTTRIAGIETNLRWLRDVVRTPAFVSGEVSTRALEDVVYRPRSVRVLSGGTATSVQDYPGREGYWAIGVPPSGPMDALSFRLGNRLLGNAEGLAGLEITATGPSLLFNTAATICLTGADFGATLDGVAVARGAPTAVAAGQTLAMARVHGGGVRGYLLVAGGLDIPAYLGSRSTFDLGEFGGHAARRVVAGDTLHLSDAPMADPVAVQAMPSIGTEWSLRVLYGPHGAPDFFTPDDIDTFTAAAWKVHYNSNRTGVRLIGPKPHWARQDGGEAGLHPSNIHDNPYAIGAIDFTGDMPIILGPDGPSLGGFVCPFVVIAADLWKVGQLAAGDSVRFDVINAEAAATTAAVQSAWLSGAASQAEDTATGATGVADLSPILADLPAADGRPRVVYRQQGDRNILVEYGPIVLDLELRIRIHALMIELERLALPGVIDIVPGIRSLQLHFDGIALDQAAALAALVAAEERLGGLDDFTIPSRVIHLPLSWKDPAIYETIAKYQEAVRDDAPWCPDNIEFIRRINGLANVDAVERIVFDATYLVMGLGDVYLGAPVATPIDPRHRLVTTKYNPARTWTPPNVVGIGGAYMCIYGMEGPGGYQLFGRTIQVWNTHRQTDAFIDGKPWLLRFFDQIRFFPVSHDELVEWRRDFPLGRRAIRVEETEFRLADYRAFLADNAKSIGSFQKQRQAAFDSERADWERLGEFDRVAALTEGGAGGVPDAAIDLPEGTECVEAPFGGVLWKVLVAPGDRVDPHTLIAVMEAMKMEFPVEAPGAGTIEAVYVAEKQAIQPGAPMFAFRPAPSAPARLDAHAIAAAVSSGRVSAVEVVRDALKRIAAYDAIQPQAWISRFDAQALIAAAEAVDARVAAGETLPLAGVPFAVKDNIDVAGINTTAGCPSFGYRPTQSATVVERLEQAGAICIGKTNLDQFATGLNGTRSPYGAPRNVYNLAYVSGGSSSGSSVVVAAGLVAFALGTDTAGSGRVPAAFNHLIGFKPSRGRWSSSGLVPACRTLDCITVLASSVADAGLVDEVVAGFDAADPFSAAVPDRARNARRIGVPRPDQRLWFGDPESERLYDRALATLARNGAELVEIDMTPFNEAAQLLYSGPWVAERAAALEAVLAADPTDLDPTVREVVAVGLVLRAVDLFNGIYRLADLRRIADTTWETIDLIALPTTGTTYRVAELRAAPIALNSALGAYTNFVNLLDMAAIAVPAGARHNATGFGITLIGPAGTDRALLSAGATYLNAADLAAPPPLDLEGRMQTVKLAVVGAHLKDMPLHWQLTSRDAVFVEATHTAPSYRLYAMAGSVPPKPALVHVAGDESGAAIAVEVYELEVAAFGSFVTEVPPPLAIGTVTLADGSSVKGFVAELRATVGAEDITALGGWRAYIARGS